MIKFNRVTKIIGRKGHRRRVFDEVDWTIRPRSQLAILSVDHVDCSVLLDIVGGAQLPTSGWVDRTARVVHASWIRAVTSGPVTPRQLMANLSKVYRVDIDALIEFADDFAELGALMNVPIRLLPRHVRQRLGIALIYGIPADFYLFDSKIQLGFPDMRERCLEAFQARRREAGMILATSQSKHARDFGGTIGILHQGSMYFSEHPEDAIAAFEKLVREDKKDRDKRIVDEPQEPEAPEVSNFDLF